MEARTASPARLDPLWQQPPLATLVRVMLVWASLLALLVSGWLAARGWGGATRTPLTAPVLAVLTLALVAAMSLVRAGLLSVDYTPGRPRSRQMVVWCLPSLAALVLALFLSLAAGSQFGLLLLWTILLAVEAAWGWRLRRHWQRSIVADSQAAHADHGPAPQADAGSDPDAPLTGGDLEVLLAEQDDALSDEVSQQITRRCAEQPGDAISGLLRARFEPHERSRSLHVAFCPPMLRPPQVEVIQLAGPRTRIKTGEVQAFGARFDLRLLAASATEQSVVIQFEASCPDPDHSARPGTAVRPLAADALETTGG